MKLIRSVIRPDKIDAVKCALSAVNVPDDGESALNGTLSAPRRPRGRRAGTSSQQTVRDRRSDPDRRGDEDDVLAQHA